MKQSLLLILAVVFLLIAVACYNLIGIQSKKNSIKKENLEYESYLNKEVYGTDVATIISKAIDQNEKNKIPKDENGLYIENDSNSVKIDLKMITIDKTYPMEEIYNSKMVNFVQNFNTIKFKCTSIEYHKKTGKISKLIFEELE